MFKTSVSGFLIFLILSALGMGCSTTDSNPTPVAPAAILQVKTDTFSIKFSGNQLEVHGSVTSKEAFTILSRGICYSTTAFPLIKSSPFQEAGSLAGFGEFSANLSALQYKKTYYFRAYAISKTTTDKVDTSYGNQVVFYGLPAVKKIYLFPNGTDSIAFIWDGFKRNKFTGLSEISGKGICFGSKPNPIPNTQNAVFGTGTDTTGFNGTFTGLQEGSFYYFRSFVINAADTAYGENFIGSTSIRDQEQNLYKTIKIGNQLWMQQNLNTSKFRNGETLTANPQNVFWDSTQSAAFSQVKTSDPGYGKFYNFYAIVDSRKLCPAGWHLPTRTNWDSLFTNLGGWNVAGLKMKSQAISGFEGLLAGYKANTGEVKLDAKFGYWWTDPVAATNSPSGININNLNDEVFSNSASKQQGFTVRCLKD